MKSDPRSRSLNTSCPQPVLLASSGRLNRWACRDVRSACRMVGVNTDMGWFETTDATSALKKVNSYVFQEF